MHVIISGRVVAAVVDDRLVEAAEARAGIGADVFEAERLEDVDHEVGAAALVVADDLDLAGADRLARGRHDRRRGLGWKGGRGWRGRTRSFARKRRPRSSRRSRRRPRAPLLEKFAALNAVRLRVFPSGPSRHSSRWRVVADTTIVGAMNRRRLWLFAIVTASMACASAGPSPTTGLTGSSCAARSRRSAGSMFRAMRRSAPASPSSGIGRRVASFQSDASGQFTVFSRPAPTRWCRTPTRPSSGVLAGETRDRRRHRHAYRGAADVRHGNPVGLYQRSRRAIMR